MKADLADGLAAQLEADLQNANISAWDTFIAGLAPQSVGPADADKMWFLRQVADCRRSYLVVLQEMRDAAYFDAWCRLECLELSIRDLMRNPIYDLDRFNVNDLARMVGRWQSIFPYRLFASPEIVIKGEDCSICGTPIDPWSDCGHDVGKLYQGEVCHRIVRQMELTSVSIVENPVQKSAVLDPHSLAYDYSAIDFVIARLPHAFSQWNVERTTASHQISNLGPISDENPCPCGSGAPHAECCKGKEWIVLPHVEFSFGNQGEGGRHHVEIVQRHGEI